MKLQTGVAAWVLSFCLWAQAPLWEKAVPKYARLDLLPDGNLLVVAGKDGVYALSAANGNILWQCTECREVDLNGWAQLQPFPLWEGGNLTPLPSEEPDDLSRQMATLFSPYMVLNTTNGKLVFNLKEQRRSWREIYGRTVVPEAGALVLFGKGPKDPTKTFSLEVSLIAAYDARTGAEKWRRPASDQRASELLQSNLASDGGHVYFLTNRALYSVNAQTGQTRWRTEIVKGISLRATTGTYVFIDDERDLVVAFGRGRVIAVRRDNGQPVWNKPVNVPRDNVLQAFGTSAGILLFTDDLQPGSRELPTGRNLFNPPLAILLRYEDGQNPWGERLKTPGLIAGYIPLDENRLFCVFQRERAFKGGRPGLDDWRVDVDVLDIRRGEFLFKKPRSLQGALLTAQSVPGGFLVQTVRRVQYISETGELLWEKPIKRPFSLPFAVREEGGVFEAYLIDDTGQLFVWRGPGSEPTPLGERLKEFANDPPQGIAYEQGKIWVWGGSTVYGVSTDGKVLCSFVRPAPAQPAAVRLLGAAVSVAGYVGSAYLAYKSLQTVLYDPDRPWDRPSQAIPLNRVLKASAYGAGSFVAALLADAAWQTLVKRRQTELQAAQNLAFLLGMQGNTVTLYGLDRSTCQTVFEKGLGTLGLFRSPQFEVDPIDKRLYVIEEGKVRAYSFQE